VLARGWQAVPKMVLVTSHKPFKLWWVPTISLERLQIKLSIDSGAIYLGGWSVW